MPLGLGSDEAPRRQRRLTLPRQRPARDKGDGRDGIKGGQNGAITGQNGMAGREQQAAQSKGMQGKSMKWHLSNPEVKRKLFLSQLSQYLDKDGIVKLESSV
jgi:hypothetical protein